MKVDEIKKQQSINSKHAGCVGLCRVSARLFVWPACAKESIDPDLPPHQTNTQTNVERPPPPTSQAGNPQPPYIKLNKTYHTTTHKTTTLRVQCTEKVNCLSIQLLPQLLFVESSYIQFPPTRNQLILIITNEPPRVEQCAT